MKFLSICIVLLSLLSWEVSAQGKAAFDIDDDVRVQSREEADGSLRKTTAGTADRAALTNAFSAATLLRGGYFTFGTSGGRSASRHDDNCQITYGHPYALTSFVELFWDGTWHRADRFFAESEQQLLGGVDTIRLILLKPGVCRLDIHIHHDAADGGLFLETTLSNLDTQAHEGALSIQFDPALGRWGDAAVLVGGTLLMRDTLLSGSAVPPSILLLERVNGAGEGLKAGLSWPWEAPEMLHIENWQPAFCGNEDPRYPRPRQLFDVVLRSVWSSATLQPLEELRAALAVDLPEPDFPDEAFIRCDLPTALTLDKGSLFPRDFPVMVEVYNGGTAAFSNAKLRIGNSSATVAPTTALWGVAAAAKQFGYAKPQFRSTEVYEQDVVAITICCEMGGRTLDSMTRYIYVPAVALSDTGLVVEIDSVDPGLLPQISVYFGVSDAWTNVPIVALRPEHVSAWENGSRLREIVLEKDSRSGVNAVDVVFALDVTGSMSGEIAGVRDNIHAFTNELTEKGISFRLGLVTFYDTIGEIFPLTADVGTFQGWVAKQVASGGGDAPENSLEALKQASLMSFRPEAHRLVIWITDEDYHENNIITKLTAPEVLTMLLAKAITVHAIGANHKKQRYDRITEPSGGLFFDINGNFRDILLDISRFNVSTLYRLRYITPHPGAGARKIDIEVHYAGKGGAASWESQSPPMDGARARLECYPNPFNPTVTLRLSNAGSGSGWLSVVDGNGREIERFTVDGTSGDYSFAWDAGARGSEPPSSGVYFIQLHLLQPGGTLLRETTSIIYTK